MNKRRIVFTVLALVWMITIFSFSARTGEASTKDSNWIGRIAGEIFVPGFEEMDDRKQLEFVEGLDHFIRKSAHACEYAFLGILIMGAVYAGKKSIMIYGGWSWLMGSVYAATDEFHQLFVEGRSGQLSDVLLDSCGVMLGVLVAVLFIKVLLSKIKRKSE